MSREITLYVKTDGDDRTINDGIPVDVVYEKIRSKFNIRNDVIITCNNGNPIKMIGLYNCMVNSNDPDIDGTVKAWVVRDRRNRY